jgi:hypothetical protein
MNMAKEKEKSKTELFDCFVGNIGGHCAVLFEEMNRFRASAVHGMSMVEIRIVPKGEHPDVWDMCYHVHEDGTEECLGNRCAAVQRYCDVASKALREWAGVMDDVAVQLEPCTSATAPEQSPPR